ncbi:hypothetical protein [Prevotella sp. KH2C16]|uniref:hypothetical protein n=1 Tax=Prevotella sp. KH2C16 TaxID=1855325 RepID=UPI0011602895|nr:hypothetical protein [Prevotella sp. KH2C16]
MRRRAAVVCCAGCTHADIVRHGSDPAVALCTVHPTTDGRWEDGIFLPYRYEREVAEAPRVCNMFESKENGIKRTQSFPVRRDSGQGQGA